VLIDPVLFGKLSDVELTRRQHNLSKAAVDDVAINVRNTKIIVCQYLLVLAERGLKNRRIPEPDVVECCLICAKLLCRQNRSRLKGRLLEPIEREGAASHHDVVLNEGRLLGLLIRLH
jgi:hypothetical protein